VIEQHGGFLGYAPAQPQGTVFSFTLPASPSQRTPAAQPLPASITATTTETVT
jgi:two-component system sensor histidine kinase DctS